MILGVGAWLSPLATPTWSNAASAPPPCRAAYSAALVGLRININTLPLPAALPAPSPSSFTTGNTGVRGRALAAAPPGCPPHGSRTRFAWPSTTSRNSSAGALSPWCAPPRAYTCPLARGRPTTYALASSRSSSSSSDYPTIAAA